MAFLGNLPDFSDISSMSSMVLSSDDADSEHNDGYGNELQLPWHENYWGIKVTHVVSPIEVWGILTVNADLLHRIEGVKSMQLKPAKYIVIGEIYFVKRSNGFSRVKAIQHFITGSRWFCECFFIDLGNFEAISHNDFYQSIGELSQIPPQVICFKLFRFDELCHCPHIERYFSTWLVGKQFIGCLMMARAQYQVQLDNGIKMPKISITPFKMNPLRLLKLDLFKQISESLPKPKFTNGIDNAIVFI